MSIPVTGAAAADPALLQFAQGMREQYRAAIPLAGEPDPVARVETVAIAADGPQRSIALRLYLPQGAEGRGPLPVVLFAHGGGFVSGDFDTHEVLVRGIANRAGALVAAVDYRLAPEAPFPAGLEDVYAALRWLHANAARFGGDPARIAVSGDSAGGNLAVAAALLARDRQGPAIAAQWLMYPMLSNRTETASWQQYGDSHFPTRDVARQVVAAYLPAGADIDAPLAAPLYAGLERLPPALVQAGECDPLRDDDVAFAAALKRAGVAARAVVYPGQTHGFMQFYKDRANNALGEAAIEEGVAFLQAAFAALQPSAA